MERTRHKVNVNGWFLPVVCEVLGLRLADVNIGERRLFITEGNGGRHRIVPISSRFFATLGAYVDEERPRTSATERLFVVLKGIPSRLAAVGRWA
jgi:site-specific recombinase XerD